MSGGPRIALVTGGNKGIGFAIVRALCRQLKDQGVVYLTARNEKLGQEAVKKLGEEGFQPKFLLLDINDVKSVEKARNAIKEQHGGLDILVNNAAIAFKNNATEPFGEQAEKTVAVNFTGTLNVCEMFFPILRPNARVVHVSSRAGDVEKVTNSAIKMRIISDDLTVDEIKKVMEDFVSAAKRGTHVEVGFPNTAYGVSKIGVTALTPIQQREFDRLGTGIVVNSCCPGWVDTDMSSHQGQKTIDEGADTPTYLALLPPQGAGGQGGQGGQEEGPVPHGQFVCERNIVDWKKGYNNISTYFLEAAKNQQNSSSNKQ